MIKPTPGQSTTATSTAAMSNAMALTTQMLPFPRRIAILGASGSIGRSAWEVIAASEGRLQIEMMSVHRRADILVEQIKRMEMQHVAERVQSMEKRRSREKTNGSENDARISKSYLPRCVIMTDEWADRTPLKDLPPEIEIRFGQDALCEYVQRKEVDVVLSAIVGSAGFRSTWAAIEAGKVVALANKESLVMGGPLLAELAAKTGGVIIPVDSEHSAVMQCLRAGKMNCSAEHCMNKAGQSPNDVKSLAHTPHHADIARVILTASGGPFRTWSLEELSNVTIKDALTHPTWIMGKKITVDSATLMNKALEIIEARWLFDLPVEKLTAVIHPQSIVHSMVEFVDGSVIAQMSLPDMQLPIQLALCFPERFDSPARKIDWLQKTSLEFSPIDPQRFPALDLGLEVAAAGGTAGTVLNAANEVAVHAFLEGHLPFRKITTLCRAVLEKHEFEERPTVDQLFAVDKWARRETASCIPD